MRRVINCVSTRESTCAVVATTTVASTSPALVATSSDQQRGLKQARTPFGYYRHKHSRQQFPTWRRPFKAGGESTITSAPHYFFTGMTKTQGAFLPKDNYVTGDWTGLMQVPRQQVYTLQHATSGAACYIRRFPSEFNFGANPSRWLIGKPLRSFVRGRMTIFDDQMLTKKQRLDYIKGGLLPK